MDGRKFRHNFVMPLSSVPRLVAVRPQPLYLLLLAYLPGAVLRTVERIVAVAALGAQPADWVRGNCPFFKDVRSTSDSLFRYFVSSLSSLSSRV